MRTLGAYVLPGDPVWLEKSLRQYYPLLTDLVVPVPVDGRGWAGGSLPVQEALAIVRSLDERSIVRVVEGRWTDVDDPLRAETAQRQAALDALDGSVDWVLQLDNDEWLPDVQVLGRVLDEAERLGLPAVEWPMRVLYRRTRRHVFEVVSRLGRPCYDYPGPIAVRPQVTLAEARRTTGPFLRPMVVADRESLVAGRAAEVGETRTEILAAEHAIVHNSWARTPTEMHRKLRSSGHARDVALGRHYWCRWWPTPVTWWAQRDLHPFAAGLWPRLARRRPTTDVSE